MNPEVINHTPSKTRMLKNILGYAVAITITVILIASLILLSLFFGYLYIKANNPEISVPGIGRSFDSLGTALFGTVPTPIPVDSNILERKFIIPKESAAKAPDLSGLSTWRNNLQGSYSTDKYSLTVVIIGRSYCPPCAQALADLTRWKNNNPEPNVSFIGIWYPEKISGFDQVEDYFNQIGVSFPVAFDTERIVVNQVNPELVPLIYIVDAEGDIRIKTYSSELIRVVAYELLKNQEVPPKYCLYSNFGRCQLFDNN